jgi:hypothetical protein
MEPTTKRRAGRPKSEPRTGPLVLGDDPSRQRMEVELTAATARELAENAGWIELSASMTTADAISTTLEYALREVFRRDRIWQERRRSGARPRSTPSPASIASPPIPATSPNAATPATTATTTSAPATPRTPSASTSPSLPPPAPTPAPREPRTTSS